MFLYDDATRLHWFRASGLDLDMEFELIGILIGAGFKAGWLRVWFCVARRACVSSWGWALPALRVPHFPRILQAFWPTKPNAWLCTAS